jgi:hypothetical protein
MGRKKNAALVDALVNAQLASGGTTPPGYTLPNYKHFIARCHQKTGRHEEAARLFRLVYAKRKAQKDTMTALYAAFHLARSLIELGRYADAKSLMLPLQRGLDSRVEQRPLMRRVYAEALYKTEGASRDEVSEAATILEDVLSLMRRRCGAGHPGTVETLTELDRARMMLEDKFQQ